MLPSTYVWLMVAQQNSLLELTWQQFGWCLLELTWQQ